MIAVIADDFTGAAEIGGLGLRHGMEVEVNTRVNPCSKADLLVICADTRSKNIEDAVGETERITTQLMSLKPSMIYKKIDSVLRGHVVAELEAQMKVSGQKKALVVPANPALGRIIRDGVYYLNGRQLHETGFGGDPDFAVTSSRIADILDRGGSSKVMVAGPTGSLPAEGIIIGEAGSRDDFLRWLEIAESSACLLAGAAAFFSVILEQKALAREGTNGQTAVILGRKMLIVCGSSFSGSKEAVEKALAGGAPLTVMPQELMDTEGERARPYLKQWASKAVALLANNDRVIVSSGPSSGPKDKAVSARICRNTAAVIRSILDKVTVQELMLEGGSTASAVLQALGIDRCRPEQELASGVIRMSVPGNEVLHVTLKPGSYAWPPLIWNFHS